MTRELKLALIVGFSLVLLVTVLISDHMSKARRQALASPEVELPVAMQQVAPAPLALAPEPREPEARHVAMSGSVSSEPVSSEISGEDSRPTEISQGLRNGRLAAAEGTPETSSIFIPVRGSTPPIGEVAAPVVSERTHTVADGETLFQISKKYYGNGNSWTKIAEHNGLRAEALKPGMKLRLPGLEPAASIDAPRQANKASRKPVDPAPVATPKYNLYTVKQGDTLAKISRKMLGSPERLADLAKLNGIEDSDSLSIGQTIRIPNS